MSTRTIPLFATVLVLLATTVVLAGPVKAPKGAKGSPRPEVPEVPQTPTPSPTVDAESTSATAWADTLRKKLEVVDAAYAGELGVYVKDLATGQEFSYRADEAWYIASGIKIPVAIEVMRRVEAGTLTLDTQLPLRQSDFVDGAGQTNWQAVGSLLEVRYLMEQMLIYSDNTATDMLIRLVELDRVNALVRELVPTGFWDITTLADVRRHAYSNFHADAFQLTSDDLLALRQQTDERKRIETLARVLDLSTGDFETSSLADAFNAYYATNLNAATLRSFGTLLELLVAQKTLAEPASTEHILGVMRRVETGQNRIKAGLPPGVAFAHKTGTQYERTCDLGIAYPASESGAEAGVIIAACTRGERATNRSERALKSVGEAVSAVGLLGSS